MLSAKLRQLLADAMPPHTPPATLTDFDLQILLQEADGGRITPHSSVTAFLDRLRKDPELAIFRERTQVVRDVGKGITHVLLAEWLLGRAGTVGANQAVTDLERYLGTELLPFHSAVAVGGIKVHRAHDLGHAMRLVPWKDVLNSRTKRAIDDAEPFHRSFYDPDSALLREVELPRVHVQHTETRKHIGSRDLTTEQDMLLCLGLCGATAPVLLASWLEPPEWAPMIRGSLSMPFVKDLGRRNRFPRQLSSRGRVCLRTGSI
jgi:hypothetical protein